MYSLSEYNQTAHLKAVKEESFEQGIAIGEERGIAIGEKQTIQKMLANGKSIEEISVFCGYTTDEINKILSSK